MRVEEESVTHSYWRASLAVLSKQTEEEEVVECVSHQFMTVSHYKIVTQPLRSPSVCNCSTARQMSSIRLSPLVALLLVSATFAQYPFGGGYPYGSMMEGFGSFGSLVPLNGYCSMSTQCYGSAVCLSQRCGCATGYIQTGMSCVSQTMGVSGIGGFPMGLGMGMPFGSGFNYPYGGYLGSAGIGAVSTSSVMYVDPGLACTGTSMCGGGSFCYQSTCSCPTGLIVMGTSCVAQSAGLAAPFGLGFGAGMTGCPTGLIFVGSTCIPQTYVQSLPSSYFCTNGCSGGATCLNGMCSCGTGMSWSNGICTVVQTTSVGIPAALVGPSVFSGPSVVNYNNPGLGFGSIGSASIVALGSPCMQTSQCGMGGFCRTGICACQTSFVQMGSSCFHRKMAKESNTAINNKVPVQPASEPKLTSTRQ